ncbi:MAG: Hint domain-containing protein, partial [Candidatus Caenarcaniphilales bacterium]|nr:Hint domain-containing protein [Candidatus Caenarcaniphilales bacterium]
KTNKNEARTVLNAFRKETKQIVELKLLNGKFIETTPDHPFYVQSKGWVEAGKLNVNDKLLDEKHSELLIKSIEIVDHSVPVYNLEIEGNHTYFAHGVLVHNVNCLITQTPDGSYIVTTTDGKTKLADYTVDENGNGHITNIDSQALADASDREAQGTLGFNPTLLDSDQQFVLQNGQKQNLYYDRSTGDLKVVTDFDSIQFIGGTGYSGSQISTPTFGNTLATWEPASLYSGNQTQVLLGSIFLGGGTVLAASETGPAAPFIGAGVGGAYFGAENNLVDQRSGIAQTIGWNAFQNINSREVAFNGLLGGAIGVASEGVFSVGSGLLTGTVFSSTADSVLGNATRPSFYVNSAGEAIPATGYRALGGESNINEALTGSISSRSPSYITFDDITLMTPNEVKNLLQLPREPSHVVIFDTLHLTNDLKIPTGRWNLTNTPEPITSTFPEWGTGGGTQAITNQPIKIDNLIDIRGNYK